VGGVIVFSLWLHDLYLRGGAAWDPARRLMRMQILTFRRTGHVPNLDTEHVRRRIAHSARYGAIARVAVECSLCHWQAMLTDWERAAHLSRDDRERILATSASTNSATLSAFLRPCPGTLYAAAVEGSDRAPSLEE
jgi:hypothetical protein